MRNTLPALRRALPPLLAAAALLMLTAPAQAQWKWRDGRGQIHVSDIPPPRDIPEKDVLQKPDLTVYKAPSAPVAAASAAVPARPSVDPELEERRRRTEQEQAARNKAEETKLAAQRKENCARARDQLAMLESGQRVATIKAGGEREIMTDEQRSAEIRRTRDIMAGDCGK